jgi:Zn finger protein HypA/HybF involved in hydrogenase expression
VFEGDTERLIHEVENLDSVRIDFKCPACEQEESTSISDEPTGFSVHALVSDLDEDDVVKNINKTQGRDLLMLEIFSQLTSSDRFREFMALNYEVERSVDEEEKSILINVHEKPFATKLTMAEIADYIESDNLICRKCGRAEPKGSAAATCPGCNNESAWWAGYASEAPDVGFTGTPPTQQAVDASGGKLSESSSIIQTSAVQDPNSVDPLMKARVASILRGKGDPKKRLAKR